MSGRTSLGKLARALAGFGSFQALSGLIFGLWALLNAGGCLAYFQDLGMGVRPLGMGEAYVAVADDSNTLMWNAAGLSTLEFPELNLMYSDLYSNLNARLYTGEYDSIGFHNIGATWPLGPEIGTVGAAWVLLNSRFYREDTIMLGFGREVGRDISQWLELPAATDFRTHAGINLKILNWTVTENEFTRNNPAFRNGLSRTGVTGDVGLLGAWKKDLKAGISLENIIPTTVGLLTDETVPFNLRLGFSYLHGWVDQPIGLESILGSIEFTHRNGISDIRAGAETWWFKHLLALRLGVTVDEFTFGFSFNHTLALGLLEPRLDYSFAYPFAIKDTYGSHRLSLVIRWKNSRLFPATQ